MRGKKVKALRKLFITKVPGDIRTSRKWRQYKKIYNKLNKKQRGKVK